MALALNSNAAAPKITFSTSKLAQGLSVNLSKTNPHLKRVAVKISWIGDDLDINAVGKDVNGNALLNPVQVHYKGRTEVVPKDLIFYMNLEGKGIKHGGDLVSTGKEETEQILVAAQDLDSSVHSLDFIVTSHVERGSALLFSSITKMKAELVDLDSNEILYTTDLDASNIQNHSAAVFASLYREDSDWSYTTKTEGLGSESQGVQNILTHYYA